MNLERRVQMLEQEVEILKNQVQETLLDIKEKVLTQTYPSLRAESNAQPAENNIHHNNGHGGGGYQQTQDYEPDRSPVRQVSSRPQEPSRQPTNHHQNAQNKVVPLEVLGNTRQNGANALQPEPKAQVDWERLEALEQWTLNKIERIGVNRTYKLLKYYLEQERIDRDTFDALVSVLKLYAKPRKKKQNSSKQAASKASSRQSAPRKSSQPQRRSRPDPKREILDEDEDEDDGRQNLILRLIAGVSNASVGVSKSKKHG